MISKELLAKAHGALGVTDANAPCAKVLRELTEAIEHYQELFPNAVPLAVNAAPQLVYATDQIRVFWDIRQSPDVDTLQKAFTPLELRIILALIDHARTQLDEALNGP